MSSGRLGLRGRFLTASASAMRRAGAALFAEGWLFLVPYLLLFLCFRFLGLPPGALVFLTRVLHVLLVVSLVAFVWERRDRVRRGDLLFWGLLAAGFLLPGAYLEFPSDPWEHFRRILLWSRDASPRTEQLAYLWAWSWLGGLELESRRTGLAVYGGFWQLLIAYQFYLLAIRLGMPRLWARVQVLATIFFMGNSALAFYRYYALSHLPMAYVAYLHSLVLAIDWARGRRPSAWRALALFGLMAANHSQTVLFSLVGAIAVSLHALCRRRAWRRAFLWAFPLLTLLGIAAAAALVPARTVSQAILNEWGVWRQPYVSSFLGTLGAHGVVGVVAALLLWRRRPLLSLLTLVPVFLLFWPPVGLLFAVVEPERPYVAFRLLYAFPTSFAIVELVRGGLVRVSRRRRVPRWVTATAAVAALLPFAMAAGAPVRGRLWFQLLRPSGVLTLADVDATARWFLEQRLERPGSGWARGVLLGDIASLEVPRKRGVRTRPPSQVPCLLVTDQATAFSIATHLSLPIVSERRRWNNPLTPAASFEELVRYTDEALVCGFLVSVAPAERVAVESAVGLSTRHWEPRIVSLSLHPPRPYLEQIARLRGFGWTRTPVPPWYFLYERPGVAPPVSPE